MSRVRVRCDYCRRCWACDVFETPAQQNQLLLEAGWSIVDAGQPSGFACSSGGCARIGRKHMCPSCTSLTATVFGVAIAAALTPDDAARAEPR